MHVRGGQMHTIILLWFFVLLMSMSGCSKEYQVVTLTIEGFPFVTDEISLSLGKPIRLIIRNLGWKWH